MNIRLFNKKYWLRRFGEQKEIRGYLVSPKEDIVVSIHVHPMGSDSVQALPEGERKIKRLEGHGELALNVANHERQLKGDLLLYHGDWYECTACMMYDHTLLAHWNYQFTLVPTDAAHALDLENSPQQNPATWKEEPEDESVSG